MVRFGLVLVALIALTIGAPPRPAAAQPFGPSAGVFGPGTMGGPGMMGWWRSGRRGFAGMCNPAATGFAEWRADQLAELIKPTEAQRAKFDDFKVASMKAADLMRNTCRTDVPPTLIGRTDAMEKRMDTMLQALRTMRPALEAFYASLSDEQKGRVDSSYVRGRFWRWRDRW